MYQYYFKIADVELEFAADYPVNWSDNMLPFSIRNADGKQNPSLQSETEIKDTPRARCFLCVDPCDMEESVVREGTLLKILPFGGRQDNYEIRFYCLQCKEVYLVIYPPILLQEGILFRRENISGYLGLEFILMDHGCFWLHASCVLWKKKGLVFSAPSGTGKSTQAELWKELEGADILNGDRVLIRKTELPAEYKVYGSPFAGSSHIYRPESGTMKAIFLLKQYPVNELEILSPAQTYLRLYGESLQCPENRAYTMQLQNIIRSLVLEVPVMELRCTPDERAVYLIKDMLNFMFNKEKHNVVCQ